MSSENNTRMQCPLSRMLALAATAVQLLIPAPLLAAESSTTMTVTADEFQFNPPWIEVERGRPVTVIFKNNGSLSHNFTLERFEAATETIQSGDTRHIRFTPGTSGEFRFVCTVPGHQAAGMKGVLNVVDQ